MTAKEIEIAAYISAHRILEVDTGAGELVCPGARRSRAVDTIADIIREVFELQSLHHPDLVDRQERTVESGPQLISHRRSAILLELPLRASL